MTTADQQHFAERVPEPNSKILCETVDRNHRKSHHFATLELAPGASPSGLTGAEFGLHSPTSDQSDNAITMTLGAEVVALREARKRVVQMVARYVRLEYTLDRKSVV